MSSTFIIDANRGISKNKDDEKLRWKNTIDGGVKLLPGDKVSVVAAQVNQRGANVNTIEFNEDVNEVIHFVYYIMDNSIYFAGDDSTTTRLYRDGLTQHGVNTRPTIMNTADVGWTNTPYLYFGNEADDVKLRRGVMNIKIPAGSYSPDNLATLVSEQFAGRYNANATPFDYVRDDALRKYVSFPGLIATESEAMITIPCDNYTLSSTTTDQNLFVNLRRAKELYDDRKDNGTLLDKEKVMDYGHWITTQLYDPTSTNKHNYVNEYQFLGSVPTLNWDSDKSRFTIGGLHAQYKIPAYDGATSGATLNAQRGEIATEFYRNAIPVGVYPRSSFGGIMITNPAYQYCLNNSSIAKTLDTQVSSGSSTEKRSAYTKITGYKFDDYWADSETAQREWKNTLWYRLGFDLSQWTDDSRWLSYYTIEDIEKDGDAYQLKSSVSTQAKLMGITTTNEITTDMALSSGGLGSTHHGISTDGVFNQNFSYEVPGETYGTSSGSPPNLPETYEMIVNELPLTARHLPSLSLVPYYNIWTDLIDTNEWVGNQGSRMSLVAQVDKNNASQDFLYHYASGIEFTITEPRTINEITTAIQLPNGKSPDPEKFDENCSVLYRIDRMIPQLQITQAEKRRHHTSGN